LDKINLDDPIRIECIVGGAGTIPSIVVWWPFADFVLTA